MKDEIILNNLGLIIKAMKNMNCQITNDDDFEDYFYSGLIGLINASKTYDETKGKSTYLYNGIRNEIIVNYQRRTSKKRDNFKKEISLSKKINNTELQDLIPDAYRFENELINKIYVQDLLDKLKNKKYKTFVIEYYGINCVPLNMREIAEKHGVSQQFVNQEIRRGLKKIKELIMEEK